MWCFAIWGLLGFGVMETKVRKLELTTFRVIAENEDALRRDIMVTPRKVSTKSIRRYKRRTPG